MPTEDVKLRFIAEVEAFRKSLEGGGASARETKDALKALAKGYAEANKGAKAAEKGGADLKKGLGALSKIAAAAGGDIAGMGAVAQGASGGLTDLFGSLGPAGVAAGVAAGAFAAAGFGAYKLAEGAVELVASADKVLDRLGKIEGVDPFGAGQLRRIDDYQRSALGLEVASGRLHVELASELAPAVSRVTDAYTGGLVVVARVIEATDHLLTSAAGARAEFDAAHPTLARLTVAMQTFNDITAATAETVLGIRTSVVAFNQLADVGSTANAELHEGTKSFFAAGKAAEDFGKRSLDVAIHNTQAAAKAITTAAAEGKRAADAAARDAQAAERVKQVAINATLSAMQAQAQGAQDLAAVARAAGADLLTPAQALTAAYWDQAEAITAKADATGNLAAGEQALAALDARLARDQSALAERQAADRSKMAADAAKDSQAQAMAIAQAQASVANAATQGVESFAGAVGGFAAEGSAAAKSLFLAQKAAGAASVVVSAEVAKMQALAQLGPIAGPPAAVGIGIDEAISLGIIAATAIGGLAGGGGHGGGGGGGGSHQGLAPPQISSHPLGGLIAPDHRVYAANPATEGVANSRGMHALGGPQGLDALNRGATPGPQVIELRYGPATLARVLVDTLRRPGTARDLVSHLAGSTGHVAGH